MPTVHLGVPDAILDPLPPEDDAIADDLEQAVDTWEHRINDALTGLDDDEIPGVLVDVLERFEDRYDQYDDYVVELRAWGQSPIYAITWRNLYASLIQQLIEHDDFADQIHEERHARVITGGFK